MSKITIKAVIEAYSSQPSRYQVGWAMPTTSFAKGDPIIHYIEQDEVEYSSGSKKDVYIGRDEVGDELFMVLADSVNVEYY